MCVRMIVYVSKWSERVYYQSECVSVSVCELWASVWMCERIRMCACTHIPMTTQGLAWVPDTAVKGGTFSKNHFGSMMGGNGVSWDVPPWPWVHCLSLSLASVSRQSFSVSGAS